VEYGDDGAMKASPLHGFPFGWGNCYGFVGLFLGKTPSKGIPAENWLLGFLKNEPFGPGEGLPPGETKWDKGPTAGGQVAQFVPGEGLFKYLIGDRVTANNPKYGDIAVFKNSKNNITHMAIVVGRSQNGKVYILQKLNLNEPAVLTTTDDPFLKGFGTPTYYAQPPKGQDDLCEEDWDD
jgi:hypothetical protein